MSPGARYIGLVIGLLGFSVAVCIALAVTAGADPSLAVEPDYYKKAIHFDEIRAEEMASERLGWRSRLGSLRVGDTVTFKIEDVNGRPITGLAGTLEAFANVRAGSPITAAVEEIGPGEYRAPIIVARAGRWEIRARLARDDEVFRETSRIEVVR